MKRNHFLGAFAASIAFIGSSLDLLARTVKKIRVENGFFVTNGKDRFDKSINLMEGDKFFTKVATKDTDGDIFVFESTRLKEGGPSHHFHFDQDEWWYVLSGQFVFKIGEEMFEAKAGDSVFGPRKVPHSFSKVGEGEGKLLMFYQPAGKMEEMFKKISEGYTKGFSDEQQDNFRIEHGIKRVGPPIKYFKKW